MFRAATVIAISVLAVASARAESAHLTGEALKQMISGRTVVLNTPVGGIPISYRGDGTMVGRAKDLKMYTGQERDKGTWWVKSDQVCQKWETWLEGRSYCFTLRLEGKVVHWRRNDGRSGTATIAAN